MEAVMVVSMVLVVAQVLEFHPMRLNRRKRLEGSVKKLQGNNRNKSRRGAKRKLNWN